MNAQTDACLINQHALCEHISFVYILLALLFYQGPELAIVWTKYALEDNVKFALSIPKPPEPILFQDS